MEFSKNDIYLLKKLVCEFDNIPYMTCAELGEKYYTSRAHLYKLLNKMGYDSYTDFQYSIRFRKDNEELVNFTQDSIFVLYKKTNDIINTEYNEMEDKYFDLYNIYCDVEESISNPLSDRLYEELLSLLYDSMELFDIEDNELKKSLFEKLIKKEFVLLSK